MNKSYLEFLVAAQSYMNSVFSDVKDDVLQKIGEGLKDAWIQGYQAAVRDFGSSIVVRVKETSGRTYEPVRPEV